MRIYWYDLDKKHDICWMIALSFKWIYWLFVVVDDKMTQNIMVQLQILFNKQLEIVVRQLVYENVKDRDSPTTNKKLILQMYELSDIWSQTSAIGKFNTYVPIMCIRYQWNGWRINNVYSILFVASAKFYNRNTKSLLVYES